MNRLNHLSSEYTKEEVLYALKNMGPLKALGPDGIQATFYQRARSAVGEEVSYGEIRMLNGDRLPQKMVDAILILIPKTEHPESIKQFRYISLCNVSFKLVTKILVNRLKTVMEEIVLPNQAASSVLPNN